MFRSIASRRGVPRTTPRRGVWAAVAAVALGASVLTGCAAGQISQTADQIANIDGAQGRVGSIGVTDAMLATPQGKNYPKGSQAPLTLWITNDAVDPDTLTAIKTDAGTVTISGKATVPPQSFLQIGGADKSVTATITGLTRDLNYGISVPVTLSFARAGDLSLNLPIEVPQQRTEPRATTNIQPNEPPDLWETLTTPTNVTSPRASGAGTAVAPTTQGPATTSGPTTARVDTTSPTPVSSPATAGTG